MTLIEEKKLNPGKGRRFGADPGKQLGEHPQKGGMIVAKNGRYGPYVSHNGVNANLPNDKTPETITLDEAVALIDARAESGGGSSARRKRPARGAPAKKAAAPKAAQPSRRSAPPRARPRRRRSRRRLPRRPSKPLKRIRVMPAEPGSTPASQATWMAGTSPAMTRIGIAPGALANRPHNP